MLHQGYLPAMFDLNRLSELARDLGPTTPSTSAFWIDPHIAPLLLKEHLNPDTDAASRRPEAIEATLSWLERTVLDGPSRILDLGCGPGLYAERLARKGHSVIGNFLPRPNWGGEDVVFAVARTSATMPSASR